MGKGRRSVFAKGKAKPGGAKRKGGGTDAKPRTQPGMYDSLNMPATEWVEDGVVKKGTAHPDMPLTTPVWWWVTEDGKTEWVKKGALSNNLGKKKHIKVSQGGDWAGIGVDKPAPFGYGDNALVEIGVIELVEIKEGAKPVPVDPETGKVLSKTELAGLRQFAFLDKAEELDAQLTDELWVSNRAMYIRIANTARACESRGYARPRGKKEQVADLPRMVDKVVLQTALDALEMRELVGEWGEIANGVPYRHVSKPHLDKGTPTGEYKPYVGGQIKPAVGSPREQQLQVLDALESKQAAKNARAAAKWARRQERRAAERG